MDYPRPSGHELTGHDDNFDWIELLARSPSGETVARLQAFDSCNPIHDPNDITKAAGYGCYHPSYPPCDSVLRQYCPEGGCKLADSNRDARGG